MNTHAIGTEIFTNTIYLRNTRHFTYTETMYNNIQMRIFVVPILVLLDNLIKGMNLFEVVGNIESTLRATSFDIEGRVIRRFEWPIIMR